MIQICGLYINFLEYSVKACKCMNFRALIITMNINKFKINYMECCYTKKSCEL